MTDEQAIKHERVVEYIDAQGLDAVLLGRRCNFSWYTCGAHNYVAAACDVGNSWLLIQRDGARVLTTNIEAARLAGEELAGTGIEIVEFPYWDAGEQIKAFDKATKSMKTAADAAAPGLNLPMLGRDFDTLRWTLTPWEVSRYRELSGEVVAAVEAVARTAEPGQTENDLAGLLSGELLRRGCMPWVVLIAADERVERYRHPLPTDKEVTRCFMLVTCAEQSGLITACTRLASFGPLPDELTRKHEAVIAVDAAMISATRPGATLSGIFAEAKSVYAAKGFEDEWRLHHQGGSCGYLPRDVIATPFDQTAILAEQAFAWNPSITGTKSEDTILCRESGPELLADTTDWPVLTAEWKGQTMSRPAILER